MISAIDFHTQVLPDREGLLINEQRLQPFKKTLHFSTSPAVRIAHSLQTFYRVFPKKIRDQIDRLTPLPAWAGTWMEGSLVDLRAAMRESSIEHAVLVAQPPQIENAFILHLAQQNPKLFTAAVNIPPLKEKPGQRLRELYQQGARVLKIHPALDGENIDSPHYRSLLQSAESLGMPVILHTGRIHSSLLFRRPELGEAQRFAGWFRQFPEIKFVLAHMNFHQPEIAVDLAETFSNVWLETSWQPLEALVEAIRRLGADRLLFGSDWPRLGHNMVVSRSRIQEGVETSLIKPNQAEQILRLNAIKLLKLRDSDAATA